MAGPGELSSVFSGPVLKPEPENAKDSHPAPKTFPWGKGDRREAVVDEGLTSAKRKSESEAFLIPTLFRLRRVPFVYERNALIRQPFGLTPSPKGRYFPTQAALY